MYIAHRLVWFVGVFVDIFGLAKSMTLTIFKRVNKLSRASKIILVFTVLALLFFIFSRVLAQFPVKEVNLLGILRNPEVDFPIEPVTLLSGFNKHIIAISLESDSKTNRDLCNNRPCTPSDILIEKHDNKRPCDSLRFISSNTEESKQFGVTIKPNSFSDGKCWVRLKYRYSDVSDFKIEDVPSNWEIVVRLSQETRTPVPILSNIDMNGFDGARLMGIGHWFNEPVIPHGNHILDLSIGIHLEKLSLTSQGNYCPSYNKRYPLEEAGLCFEYNSRLIPPYAGSRFRQLEVIAEAIWRKIVFWRN